MHQNNMNLAEWLTHLRKTHGFSQQQIADKLKLHKSLYCNYERAIRIPDLDKLKLLAEIYNVPLRSMIRLPLKNTVIYSDGLLDKLDKAIKEHGIINSDINETRSHYKELKNILNAVINERNEALEFPDLNIDFSSYDGKTIKEVKLDLRGELLIERALNLQMEQLESFTGFQSKEF